AKLMSKLLIAFATTVALVGPAHAKTYTYMCRVDHKLYPVTVTTPNEGDSSSLDEKKRGTLSGGTIMWRGVTFRNVTETGDCKANFVATHNGVTIELCTATQGVADLTIGEDTFECQMPGRGRPMPPPSPTIPQVYRGEWCKPVNGGPFFTRGRCS